MAYHIITSRSIYCVTCVENLELLSPTDKMASEEAKEMGWRHKKEGWQCPRCQTGDEC